MRGLEERGALRGLVGSGAVRGVGGSEWLEDSGCACPFSHHRIYAHMYKGAPGGSGGSGTGKARPATVESERRSGVLQLQLLMMMPGA